MIVYCILEPSHEEPLGYIRCAAPPSPEQMADHLAIVGGFENRDHFLHVNPGISLGFAPLH